jgi:flagellar biosynthesis protein
MQSEKKDENRERRMQAAALQYDQGKHEAPVMLAKGSGAVAEKIIALAKEHDIPLQRDPELMQILMKLEINQEIPENVFHAVAEILAMVYKANRNQSEKNS